MTPIQIGRLGALSTAVALMAACSGQSADPLSPTPPSLAVFSAGEADLVICKASATAGNFDYTWTITLQDGTPVSTGTVTGLASGDCVLARHVTGTGSVRYRASVTEAPLAADWSLTGIVATYTHAGITTMPVVDLGARTISNILLTHDVGATVTFTNVYTAPPPPPTGCTLTQGYWKTHSEFGPAPYDNTWAQLANGASTAFYLSGGTWYSVFHTSPAGNAYYSLAHQYMAAQLSIMAGADPTAAAAAITAAEALFNTYTPAQIRALKGNDPVRQQFLTLAETLDDYNNGLTGPGHCN